MSQVTTEVYSIHSHTQNVLFLDKDEVMKTMSVAELKNHFSEALKCVEHGEKIGITYGKKKEIKALLVPKEEQPAQRKLGILEGKGEVVFMDDYKLTEEEFLGL